MPATFASRTPLQNVEEGRTLAPRWQVATRLQVDVLRPSAATGVGDAMMPMIGWIHPGALRRAMKTGHLTF
jgi:hypothetical protein